MDFMNVRGGDEIVVGKIRGVRFWSYALNSSPPREITSFQNDIRWVASRPAEPDEVPTMENGRGLNVYKTIGHALENSADAVAGVVEDSNGFYCDKKYGLVLGAVDLWGCAVEHERGYHAQYVEPVSFDQAWGYDPDEILADLNDLWFTKRPVLSFEENVLLAIQRGGRVFATDVGRDLRMASVALLSLERWGLVTWRHSNGYLLHPHVYKGFDERQALRLAKEQGECLTCGKQVSREMCANRTPRMYQITMKGQNRLLSILRGNHV